MFQYFFLKEAYNSIETAGLKYLSRGKWLKLKKLQMSMYISNIDGCKINDEGCVYLSRASWPSLQKIGLSNAFDMKIIISFD